MNTVPIPHDWRKQVDEWEQKYREKRLKRERACPPRGSGPAQGFRPSVALPPPHYRVSPAQVMAEFERDRQVRIKRFGDRFPVWAVQFARRVHERPERELARVPKHVARRVLAAASHFRTESAKRSVIALGLTIAWLSSRHPKRCGKPSTLAGLPVELWASLTRKADGSHYSASYVGHGWHGRGTVVDFAGRRMGADGAQRGFLVALVAEGLVRVWVPPARKVEEWMRGESGYAFACVRIVDDYVVSRGPPS